MHGDPVSCGLLLSSAIHQVGKALEQSFMFNHVRIIFESFWANTGCHRRRAPKLFARATCTMPQQLAFPNFGLRWRGVPRRQLSQKSACKKCVNSAMCYSNPFRLSQSLAKVSA